MRRLTSGERAIARTVFADALDLDRVRLISTPFRTAVTTGPWIWMPYDAPPDFAAAPLHLRAWLVHELTHVWQFATAPASTLKSWVKVAAAGGYGPGLPGYRYALPFEWAELNLEQQARVIEHAYMLREGGTVPGAALSDYVGRTPFEGASRSGGAQAAA